MLTVTYLGQQKPNGCRFAIINCSNDQSERVVTILHDYLKVDYDGYGDCDEMNYWVEVDSKEDYDAFMSFWKEAKKIYK